MTAVGVDQEGNELGPIEGATVTITGEAQETGQTDSNGEIRFETVPIGSYTVTGTADGYEEGSASISAGDFA